MPTGIASRNCVHVGAVPRSTFSTSVDGESTRKAPTQHQQQLRQEVDDGQRDVQRRPTPSTPTTLMTQRIAMTIAPTMMSPGAERSGSQNSPPM